MNDTKLKINEIFYSIQGESTLNGIPSIFIRLTYCNLRCSYCDTEYAFYEGKDMTIDEILDEISRIDCKIVEITGGEPLVQKEIHVLIKELLDRNYKVMLETGGSLSIENVHPSVKIIMDLKTPSSLMAEKNLYENINYIKPDDEIKFVIGTREDFDWANEIINKYKLTDKCKLLMSPVFDMLSNLELATWILNDNLNVRFQIQLHKYIWHPELRGV